jgi:two-component system, NarL family, sensor kinase
MKVFNIILVFALFVTPVLAGPQAGKNAADSLLAEGWSLLTSDPTAARQLAREALEYISGHDTEERITILSLKGISFYIQANYPKASEYHLQALKLAADSGKPLHIANAYNNLGLVNFRSGNIKDALDMYLHAMNYYNDLNDEIKKANTLNNIGVLYAAIQNYPKARQYYDQAFEGFSAWGDGRGLAAFWNNLGSLHFKQNNIDSAFHYLYNAIELETRNQNRFGLSSGYFEIAGVYSFQGAHQTALDYYRKSAGIAAEVNHSYQQAASLLGAARCYLMMGQVDPALREASRAMDIANQIDTDQLRLEVHRVYSQIFEEKGDVDSSLYHLNVFVELNEHILDQSKVYQIYNQEILHLSQAREIQNLQLQRKDLQISRKNTVIWLVTLAFLLTSAASVLLYYNYHFRQIARHQKDIASLTEKKSRAATEAEIQERKRIGLELHDGLGQRLSLARLSISTVLQKSVLPENMKVELLETALSNVDQAFQELRSISRNLSPSPLTRGGLVDALRILAGEVNRSAHIKARTEFIGMNGPLDKIIENAIYRSAQELINNVLKHARASEIYLQLIRDDQELTLIVEDNGVGFRDEDIKLLSAGGLKGIQSKIENIGGKLLIDAFPDRGTMVSIIVPV